MSGTPGRLLSLLSLLQARRDWPGALLAERLAVSPRTVRRDVERLRELGYPVLATMGPDGGYRLQAGADLPPLLFDDEQAVALAVALQLAAGSDGGGGPGAATADAAWRALATVRQVLPARLRQRVDAVQVAALPTGAPPLEDGVLVAVTEAVRAREVLRFGYRAGPGGAADPAAQPAADAPPRRVEPHRVLARAGRWYLLAWDLDRGAWRTFRLDRVVPRTPTGPRFTPRDVPGGDTAAFVAALFRGAREPGSTGADGGWPCRGEVVLAAPASAVAPHARDGAVEPLGPDRCRLHAGAWSWPALAALLARFDADVEVVGPPELAAAFAALARRCERAAASLAGAAG